jgi:hypothetical protein
MEEYNFLRSEEDGSALHMCTSKQLKKPTKHCLREGKKEKRMGI